MKRIALVAHDLRKPILIDWAKRHKEVLSKHHLIATGTTGRLLEKAVGCEIERVESGPLGGDAQLGAMITEGKIDFLIFFWDALSAHAHENDIRMLLRLCVVWNIPHASNRSTADFIIESKLWESDYVTKPNYKEYRNRKL